MFNVIPAPQHVSAADAGNVHIDSNSWIDAGDGTELASAWLQDGLKRFAAIELAGSAGSGVKISLTIGNVPELSAITTGVRPDGGNVHDEGYSIEVANEGIDIVGDSAEAVFRGVTTLVQLAAQSGGEIAAGTIADSPRFAWRGLSFDTVRCFHSVDTVKQVLDLLALYKMNVLHFHLTDSEGWRFQVDAWPKLTEVSGKTARNGRPGGDYTPEEFADIVQYAADRFIRVIPEFDTPGHTASVLRAYPELGASGIADMPEAMQYLHPDQPGIPDLLRDVYGAMAAQTSGGYIHIGGDEAIAMEHETFQRYIQMAAPIARGTGKGIVAWQEAARGGLAEGDLLQWWIPDEMVERIRNAEPVEGNVSSMDIDPQVMEALVRLMAEADKDVGLGLEHGANVILSPAKWLYLDTKYTEQSADPAQTEQHTRVGLPSFAYDNGSVEDSYNWDPATVNKNLPLDRVAGVEAAIWCEFIESADDLFFQLLPRLAGAAEKAWSEHREWDDHRTRLANQPVFWDAMGVNYFKSSTVW